jgi:hypothetical protein
MKSVARCFLFGFIAASLPAVACMLAVEVVFGRHRHMAVTIAILCAQAGCLFLKFARRSRSGKSESAAAADAAASARTPIHWKIAGCIAGVASMTALFFSAVSQILEIPSDAGQFDRVQMEALVGQVRSQNFSGDREFHWSEVSGTMQLFSGTDDLHWTAVSGTAAFSNGAAAGLPNLWAERTGDQNLKVIIWTKTGGHASFSYGFAYSDVPLAADGSPKDSLIFFTSGPNSVIAHPATPAFDVAGLHLRNRIDAHWWEVYDGSGD